jgi:gliding motility-associated-like protein
MKKLLFLFIWLFVSIYVRAQITVTNTAPFNSPTYLVNNILLGNGVSASNVTFAGQSAQLGFFYNGVNGAPNLGIDSGIVISTGNVNDIPKGGSQPSTGQYNGPGDPDLLDIAQSVTSNPDAGNITSTNDRAFLEFDFTPVGDTVEFRFVFASEEYTSWINSVYNDIFAFFVSGPGISGPYAAPAAFPNGAINVAQVPGTSTPITISSIHPGLNSQYYVSNTNGTNNDFNGFTKAMTIKFYVQCGGTYHFKIAIADCEDDYLDTGVFIEAGSFSSETVQVDVVTATGDSTIIEGCGDAMFTFTRPGSVGDYTVYYDIGGNAINGSDYTLIADSLTIPDGSNSASLTITPLLDGLTEGQDTLTITAYTIDPCGDTIVSIGVLYILDIPSLAITASDIYTCVTPTVGLVSTVSGSAVAPYTYQWTNNAGTILGTNPNLIVSGNQTDTFYVSVTDSCNLVTVFDTVNVVVDNALANINTSGDTTLYCAGEQINLTAFPVDSVSIYNYGWSTGANGAVLTVTPTATVTYYVTATNLCNGSTDVDTINVVVDYTPMAITSTTQDTVFECLGLNYNLDLFAEVENGTLPYSFEWTGGATSTDSLFQTTVNAPTSFYVKITDHCGQFVEDTVNVTFAPYVPLTLTPSIPDSTCSGSDAELSVRPNDGVAPYSFLWSTGDVNSSISYTTSGTATITVNVEVTDKCLFTATTSIDIPIKLCEVIAPNIFTPNGDNMNETLEFTNLENYKDSELSVFNRWGKMVYSSSDYKNDWDGDDLGDGTYFYILNVNNPAKTIFKGTFTLLR